MMTLTMLLLFIPACFALNMAPGPNNLLSLTNAKRYDIKTACLAGIGRLIAFVGMITLAATGLATVLYTSETIFLVIKTLGGLYLLWLAYQLWSARTDAQSADEASQKSLFGLAWQEFWLAAGNPKAILIFTAFLPQFVEPDGNVVQQFMVLGALFLLLEWVAIAGYAYAGSFLGNWFSQPKRRQLFNRLCAGLLASAGIGLLLAKKE